MDEQEMAIILSIVPDPVLCGYAAQEAIFLSESFAQGDTQTMIADIILSQMIHAEMIWRGLDADALDFFSKINAIVPVINSMTYTEYVEMVREARAN